MSVPGEMASAASVEVASEYRTALMELNSSKPQITFLTMLADESKEHGTAIVSCIAEYATSCPAVQKLPLLYLVDSIIKNVRGDYVKQFQQKIHHMFANIFEKVDERTRRKMYELRQTWNDIFRKSTLYSLDMKVQALDPAWPVTAPTPSGVGSGNMASARTKSSTIFVNPSILKSRGLGGVAGTEVGVLSKELELLELKKQKLALEKEKVLALGKQNLELRAKGLGIGASGTEAAQEDARQPFSRSERKPSSSYGSSNVASHADLLKGKGYRIKKRVMGHFEPTPPPTVSSTTPGLDAVVVSAPPPVPAALQRPPPSLVPPTPQPDRANVPTTIHVDPRHTATHLLPPHLRKPTTVVSSTPTSTVSSNVPSSQSADASLTPTAKTATNFVSLANRDPRAQASAAGGSNRNPRGMAVSNSSSAPLVTASATSSPSVTAAAGLPTAVSSRDPRMKADPRLKPPDTSLLSHQQQLVLQHNKFASSRDLKNNASSANGGSGSKGRATSAKSRSKERSNTGVDKDQLFKPDIVTKVPSKIKIDLNLNAKKLKPNNSRDPREKTRDPRGAGKESKGESPVASVTDAATSRVTHESTLAESSSSSAKDKRSRSVSTDREKEAGRSSRDKSADRREEIKRELKKVDKKESRSHSRPRKDRSSSPKQRNRSRERSSREPEKKKADISSLSAQAAVTSEGASQLNVTFTTAPTPTVAPTPSDATPATPRSAVSSSSTLPELTVSDLAVTLAAVMTSSSLTTAKTTSSPSTTPSHDASPPPVSSSSHLSSAAQDSFRSVDRDRSRKRNIRKRTSLSPEPSAGDAVAAGDDTSQQEEAPPQDGQGKEDATDSDESDHYEANKPNPAVYTDKKGASIAGSGDVDLRLFNSPPKRLGPDDTAKMSRVDELFGSEDVDLRTLGSSNALPPLAAGAGDSPAAGAAGSSLPAAFQPSTGGPPPAATVGDQDLRSGLPAATPNRTQEPAVAMPPGVGSNVAVRREGGDQSPPAHPQNWDHFREKNPHFKEYQRQCSTPSLPDMQSPHMAADPARVRAKIRRRLLDDEDALGDVSGGSSPGHDAKTRENLQVIASQAEEQLKTGQISLTEYNSTLQKVLGLFEMEKVQRARERARSCSSERQFLPTDPHEHVPLQPPPHLRRGEDGVRGPGGRGVDPLPPPPLPPHMRMPHPRDVRGRGRGHLPPPPKPMFVGGGFGPERGEFGVPRARGDGDVNRFRGGFPDEWTGEPDLPYVLLDRLHAVQRIGETRTIDIDGQPREIRTYGGTAIVLLDQFEPRTLSFEEGHCDIVFEEGKFTIPMHTTDDYKEFKIDGETHRIRLGVPTQELFLDGRGYQCFFGGKPITIHLAGCSRTIRLDGKPPSVVIGKERNVDYLLGKISLVINANTKRMLSLYLDARPQRIVIDSKPLVLKFIDKFRAIEINSVPFPVDFGGLPLAISVKQLRKYLSFSSIPPDIIPGQTCVLGMDSDSFIPIYPENRAHLAPFPLPKSLPSSSAVLPPSVAIHPPPMPPNLPMFPPPPRMPSLSSTTTSVPPSTSVLPSTSVSPTSSVSPPASVPPPASSSLVAPPPFPKLMPATAVTASPVFFPLVVTPKTEPVPITTSTKDSKNTSSTVKPPPPAADDDDDDISIVPGSYITKQGANDLPPPRSATPKMAKPSPPPGLPSTSSTSGPSTIDVSTLLQTLIKVGIIGKPITAGCAGTASEGVTANGGKAAGPKGDRPIIKVKKMEELKTTQNVVLDENDQDWTEQDEEGETTYKFYNIAKMDSLFKSQQLRRRSGALVSALYRGMQCSSCGMRYPPEQTVQYSHHLDWHFRQNKREQESTKKANARKFYIPIDDWMHYEEIEDVEERVPSMFENDGSLPGELGRQSTEGGDDETELSVPVSSDEPGLGVCPVCHDTFTQFFQHDTDEWHYRDAVARDGANYHPSCHQDLLRQKEKEEEKKNAEEKLKLEEEEKAKLKKEEDLEEAKLKEEKVKALQEEVKKGEEGAEAKVKENGVAEDKEGAAIAADGPAVAADGPAVAADGPAVAADGAAVAADGAADGAMTDPATTHEAVAAVPAPVETTAATDAVPAAATGAADAVATPELPSGTDTPEAAASPADPEKKKKKKKKKKKPVVEPIVPTVRIKEEPTDADDISFFIPPGQVASGVTVKQEKPDEPEIQEEAVAADEGIEEMDQTAAEDDLSMMLDTAGELSTSAAQTNLMISTIDGNVEQTAAPDTQPDAATAPRIRLSGALGNLIAKTVAKAAKDKAKEGEDKAAPDDDVQLADPSPITVIGGQVSGEPVKDKPDSLEKGTTDEQEKEDGEKADAHKEKENGLAEDEGVEGGLTDDDDIIEWDEFIPPPFTPHLTNHPKFEGVQLQDLGVQRAGIEISGMCSIM